MSQKTFLFHWPRALNQGFVCLAGLALFAAPAYASTPDHHAEKRQAPPKRTAKGVSATKAPASRPATKQTSPKKTKAKKAKKKATPKGRKKLKLTNWLRLGPAPVPMPVFAKDKRQPFKLGQLFKQRHLEMDQIKPTAGQKVWWFPARQLQWKEGATRFKAKGKTPHVGYLATYLETDRYLEAKLAVRSHQRVQIFLNGRMIGQKASCTKRPKVGKKGRKHRKHKKHSKHKKSKKAATDKTKPAANTPDLSKLSTQDKILLQLTKLVQQQNKMLRRQAKTLRRHSRQLKAMRRRGRKGRRKAGQARARLRLTPGKHLLVLKTLYAPGCVRRWKLKTKITPKPKQRLPFSLQSSLRPKHFFSLGFSLNRKSLRGGAISPNGKLVVIWVSKTNHRGKTEWWSELRRTSDGSIVHSNRAQGVVRELHWAPNGKYYSFVSRHGRMSHLWLTDRKTGKVRRLLGNLRNFGTHIWAPNSRFLVYNASHTPKPTAVEKAGLKRLRGMPDRWPWYRRRSSLYAIDVKSGTQTRLTAGHWGTGLASIRFDGKKLLFTHSRPDFKRRHFSYTDLYELDLRTFKAKKLLGKLDWLRGAMYSPNGKQLLLMGSALLFGPLGVSADIPKGQTPNGYNTQAFLYDLDKREAKAITKNFNPMVTSAYWHPLDSKIYFSVLNRTRYQIFRYDPATAQFQQIPTGVDAAGSVSYAPNSSRVTFVGKGIQHAGRLYTLDLHSPRLQMLYDPSAKASARVQLGQVKDFNITLPNGEIREGRVYYPPRFDARKRYPTIVYYYGGTYPTPRGFDGRYSFHLWAAHGFMVYVIQPSGAVGYGQRHAALHVNEWGSIVADEIIAGTKAYLQAHSFADPKRVGCIGASYGGFMTMYLITRTSLFRAAISHAGISNLASYWGGGYWGYLYSSVATAKRYPWSHPEFYVNQSPLYNADKITTPLLLLHGSKDTNVPPFESYQMYTALRVLGKKVEFVEVKGTDHWVLQYRKRVLWTQTILSWFGRELQDRKQWWEHLHGKHKH